MTVRAPAARLAAPLASIASSSRVSGDAYAPPDGTRCAVYGIVSVFRKASICVCREDSRRPLNKFDKSESLASDFDAFGGAGERIARQIAQISARVFCPSGNDCGAKQYEARSEYPNPESLIVMSNGTQSEVARIMSDIEVADGASEEIVVDLDEALKRAIRGGSKVTDAHLRTLERDLVVDGTKTSLHCYFLPLDGNGRVRFKPLAEFLRDRIVDYAIPRRAIEDAKKQMAATGSMAPVVKLQAQARGVFTHLSKTGEGGELLLFAMAEAAFGLTQILCKMSLKTSKSMHYHGADGVYATARPGGGLNICHQ